jgi:predicted esterase YcpF (UPF0227 family)
MKNITAVEWLVEKYNIVCGLGSYELMKEHIAQAKAMEKDQIIAAHLLALIYPLETEAYKQAEQYYNETYNTNTP